MSDPKYEYATQNNFTGGICTEPELRRVAKSGEITVAEAADVWAPNGVLKRRPGVVNITSSVSATPAPTAVAVTGEDLVGIAVYVSDTSSVAPIYATWAGTPGSSDTEFVIGASAPGYAYIPLPSGVNAFKLTGLHDLLGLFAGIVWVPPGGALLTDYQWVNYSQPTTTITAGTSCQVTVGKLWVVFRIPFGAASPVPLIDFSGSYGMDYLTTTDDEIFGSTYSPLPSAEVYLSIYESSTTPGSVVCAHASSVTGTPTETSAVAADPALFNANAAPTSWATVVDANRTYVAFSNQVYEYRPDLATASQFRLAQVNSDPAIVGPGATYDPTIFAQYNVFPHASQIIYFGGLLFFTGIKGAPNAVQWGGPALDGAVDILPVLSYAILSDSRDNSPNVGFGVFNSNLYVFKQNSVWAMIPAGQSEVDGSYLFTSRLITSGAGCTAPGSIVSTPEGIIFYNSGGFYIFNGQKTEKLTKEAKKLFDAIVPGNAYQMQAAHWPQQHSYVVTCKMTHPWASDVFEDLPSVFDGTLGYDYQNNAWWLWLSVSGKALYMDGYGNFITQRYYNEYRILDPFKEYDSDALAKSTATPYIKTQRLGWGESLQKKNRELRVAGEIDNLGIETSIEINDQLLAATDYDMTFIPVDYAEIPLGDTIPDGDPYSPPWGRREVRVAVKDDGQWAQVRLNGNYGPFTVYNINLGYYVDGRNG